MTAHSQTASAVACLLILALMPGCGGQRVPSLAIPAKPAASSPSATVPMVDGYPLSDLTSGDLVAAREVLTPKLSADVTPQMLRHSTQREQVPLGWWSPTHTTKPYKIVEFTAHSPQDEKRHGRGWIHIYTVILEKPGSVWQVFRIDEGV